MAQGKSVSQLTPLGARLRITPTFNQEIRRGSTWQSRLICWWKLPSAPPAKVVTSLRSVDGIESADVVTGPFDVIALINVEDFTQVGLLVTERVHTIPGIVRATSYPVVDL